MNVQTVENQTSRLAQFRRFQLCVNLPGTADFCGCAPEEPENNAEFHAGTDLFGKTRKGGRVRYPFDTTIPCLRREEAASVRRRIASPSAVDRGEQAEDKGRIGALCTGAAPGMVGGVVSTSVVLVLL